MCNKEQKEPKTQRNVLELIAAETSYWAANDRN